MECMIRKKLGVLSASSLVLAMLLIIADVLRLVGETEFGVLFFSALAVVLGVKNADRQTRMIVVVGAALFISILMMLLLGFSIR